MSEAVERLEYFSLQINPELEYFSLRVKPLLERLYDDKTVEKLLYQLFNLLKDYFSESKAENLQKWSENDVLVITYANSIRKNGEKPLVTLGHILEYFQDTVTGVHILPFFPYTSDDGYAVTDYMTVNPELGDWQDIKNLAGRFDVMFDLVINHISSQHIWFQQYQQGLKPGCDYFIEVNPSQDLSQVVRPRSSPLLTKVNTVKGEKYVWTTFSEDQIDVNFANPDVLWEYVKILLFYVQKGARFIRLDAVGFLWKKIGTACIHLPETHTVVKLLREILQIINPSVVLLTETNVPNRENLSYFGARNEAHMIYNFSLAPLVLNALLQGKSDHLKTWMMGMPPAPIGCAYLNFTASHDGIGLRPAEGLLLEDEYETLLAKMQDFGGKISMRKKADGRESPYEINISLFDAMKGTAKGEDQWQIERFLCFQTIMMSIEGVPAFYIHTFLATSNDHENVKRTNTNRAINRHQWDYDKLVDCLEDPHKSNAKVFRELSRRIKIRRGQEAFHPNATQYTLHPGNKALFVFWRQSLYRDQSIFCVNNLSDQEQRLCLSELNLIITDPWCDLLSGQFLTDIYDVFILKPYQSAWITNKF